MYIVYHHTLTAEVALQLIGDAPLVSETLAPWVDKLRQTDRLVTCRHGH